MKSQAGNPLVVERYTGLERLNHLVHAAAMLTLIITGLRIYFGWDFMSFHNARALHMFAVIFLLVVNWFLIPVTWALAGKGGIKNKVMHFFDNYIFGPKDGVRMAGIIGNFFGKGKYPAFTIYDESGGHYKTKLHPVMKILVVIEGLCNIPYCSLRYCSIQPCLVVPGAPNSIMDSFGRGPDCTYFRIVFPGVL